MVCVGGGFLGEGGNSLPLPAQSMEPINHFLPVATITAHRPLHHGNGLRIIQELTPTKGKCSRVERTPQKTSEGVLVSSPPVALLCSFICLIFQDIHERVGPSLGGLVEVSIQG